MMRVLVCILAGLVLATRAEATVILPADLGELARDARAIVRGQVVATEAQWTAGRRSIETLVTVEAATYLKGALGGTVVFRVPGGVVGRFRNVVVGAPRFEVGQQVIVFLGARGPTVPFVLGLTQGVYRVKQGEHGAWMVVPSPVLPGVVGPQVRGSAQRQPAPLADFEATVKALVQEAK